MKFILAILLIIFASSCNETPIDYNVPPDPNLINDYFPLQIGNYWVYDYFEFDAANEKYPSSVAIDSIVAVDTINIYGNKIFILHHFRNNEYIGIKKIISAQDSVYMIADSAYLKTTFFGDITLQLLNIRSGSWLTINQNNIQGNVFLYGRNYPASSSIRLFTNYEGEFSLLLNDLNYIAKSYYEILDIKSIINNTINESDETVNVQLFQRQEFKRSFADSIGMILEIMQPKNLIIREYHNDTQMRELVFKSRGHTLRLRNYYIKQ